MAKLEEFIKKEGSDKIAYIFMCCNVEGVHLCEEPFSIANLRDVSKIAKKYNIPIILEGSNLIGNAYIIKEYEEEFKN